MKFLLQILVVLNLFSCQQDKRSKLDKNDFSIMYPSSLELDETGKEGTVFVLKAQMDDDNDVFIENINLATKEIDNKNFNDFANQTKQEIGGISKLVESKKLKLNGRDCLRLKFKLYQNDIELTFIQHYYLKNNKAYVLTFSSESKVFDSYFDEMNNVLMSFKLK